jgi:predicted CopG family antitoxin
MAVKTITIDMEAYDLLAAARRDGESFSRVIKRRLGGRCTGAVLAERLSEICLDEATLDNLDRLVAERSASPAESPTW